MARHQAVLLLCGGLATCALLVTLFARVSLCVTLREELELASAEVRLIQEHAVALTILEAALEADELPGASGEGWEAYVRTIYQDQNVRMGEVRVDPVPPGAGCSYDSLLVRGADDRGFQPTNLGNGLYKLEADSARAFVHDLAFEKRAPGEWAMEVRLGQVGESAP